MLIGICSPSDCIGMFSRRIDRANEYLQSLGFKTLFSPHARDRDETEHILNPSLRANDIHYLIKQNVNIILMSTGGSNSNSIIPYLDMDLIRSSNVQFAGFSDSTSLLLYISSLTNNQCYYGPSLMGYLGDYQGASDYSINSFLDIFKNNKKIINYKCPTEITNESLFWDKDDNRKRLYRKSKNWNFNFDETIEGKAVGGNLTTLVKTLGTEHAPLEGFNKDNILFIEDLSDLKTFLSYLSQLEQIKGFKSLKGILIGRILHFSDEENDIFLRYITQFSNKLKIPIATEIDFSHSDPRMIIPLKQTIKVNPTEEIISIYL